MSEGTKELSDSFPSMWAELVANEWSHVFGYLKKEVGNMAKRLDARQIRTMLKIAKECNAIMCELEVSVSSVSSTVGWSGTKCYLKSLGKTYLLRWFIAVAIEFFRRLKAHG